MRKFIVSITLILLPCLLLSCTDSKGGNVETSENSSDSTVVETGETTAEGKLNSDKTIKVLDSLSEYITDEGYTGTDQETLVAIVSKYSYQGASLPELIPGAMYDGIDNSGGMQGGNGTIGYHSHFSYPENGKNVHYNNFYTRVPLDGLALPFEIGFDDTVYDVLKKLGLDFNPNSFTPDSESNRMKATLLTSENSSLVFYNYLLSEIEDYEDNYLLQLTDTYYFVRWDGEKFPLSRKFSLYFNGENKLCKVYIEISNP